MGKLTKNRVFWKFGYNFLLNLKTYIICCVPAQIPYLERLLFLKYGPKCSQPIRLQDFIINHISRTNQWNSLIFCMLIQVLKGHGTLKLIISQDWIDGMNWFFFFFAFWCKFRKAKSYFNDFWVGVVRNRRGYLVYETLKICWWFYELS